MLYIVATPIGNLRDITLRAIDTLRTVDYILCEDTRTSKSLLAHYQITTPLKSFHKFNERQCLEAIIAELQGGREIALISDAGTPTICDPGAELVARCHQLKLPLCTLPGASAVTAALSLSGSSANRWQFIGFLPKKTGELRRLIAELLHYPGLTLCYEAPHRLLKTLSLLPASCQLGVAREISKVHEEFLSGSAEELVAHFTCTPARGEVVLVMQGREDNYGELSPREHVALLQREYALSSQEAVKLAAQLRGASKSALYRALHHEE